MARKRNEARSIISSDGAAAAPVTHRRSVRATVAPPAAPAEEVQPQPAVAEAATGTISKRKPVEPQPVLSQAAPVQVSEQDEIAMLAYSYWEARGGSQDGSPEDDWVRAEKEVRRRRAAAE